MRRLLVTAAAVLVSCAVAHAEVVRLQWNPPSEGTPTHYRLYRSVGGAEFTVLAAGANIPADQLTFIDVHPELGTLCYFVTALDAQGESPGSNTACKTFTKELLPVSAPQTLRIVN